MTVEIAIWRRQANFAAIAPLIFILSFLFSVRQHAQTEKQAISFDPLVKNGTIVTMDGEHRIFKRWRGRRADLNFLPSPATASV